MTAFYSLAIEYTDRSLIRALFYYSFASLKPSLSQAHFRASIFVLCILEERTASLSLSLLLCLCQTNVQFTVKSTAAAAVWLTLFDIYSLLVFVVWSLKKPSLSIVLPFVLPFLLSFLYWRRSLFLKHSLCSMIWDQLSFPPPHFIFHHLSSPFQDSPHLTLPYLSFLQ